MSVSKVAVALISCAVFSAQAQTANVAQDFSIGSNPGGAWSYGWASSLGQSFGLNLFNWAFGAGSNVALGWSSANPANVSDANPSVLYLLNGTGQLFSYSTISAPSGSVNLHPGPADELAVVRWTAPTAGTYLVSGAFRGNDVAGTTTDVHILRNSTSVMDGVVNGAGALQAFSQTLALAAGDRVDFAVGTGGNGFFNDSTGLSAVISAVPEPSSYALMLIGLGTLAAVARRRKV